MEKIRPYKVYAIKEGVVIDHLPLNSALDIVKILGANRGDTLITLGTGLESKKGGKKDVVKLENSELTEKEFDIIALIAPQATVNLIKNHKVIKKITVQIPPLIKKMVECNNPSCITNHETMETKFQLVSEKPMKVKCYYCERLTEKEDIKIRS